MTLPRLHSGRLVLLSQSSLPPHLQKDLITGEFFALSCSERGFARLHPCLCHLAASALQKRAWALPSRTVIPSVAGTCLGLHLTRLWEGFLLFSPRRGAVIVLVGF